MAYPVAPATAGTVRPLANGLGYHVSIDAVLDGNNPGVILVDDQLHPQSVIVLTPEGNFLAGRHDNAGFNQALNGWLAEHFFSGEGEFVVCVDPPQWLDSFAQLAPGRRFAVQQRRRYTCHAVRDTTPLLAGYRLARIDAAFLNRVASAIPAHIHGWIANNWGTPAAFLERGFGFCTLLGDQVVCWCIADCVSGTRCEVGIHTVPEQRRRGLAAATVAATAGYALAHGFAAVGWHCADDNIGSWKTAERAGFELTERYQQYYCQR